MLRVRWLSCPDSAGLQGFAGGARLLTACLGRSCLQQFQPLRELRGGEVGVAKRAECRAGRLLVLSRLLCRSVPFPSSPCPTAMSHHPCRCPREMQAGPWQCLGLGGSLERGLRLRVRPMLDAALLWAHRWCLVGQEESCCRAGNHRAVRDMLAAPAEEGLINTLEFGQKVGLFSPFLGQWCRIWNSWSRYWSLPRPQELICRTAVRLGFVSVCSQTDIITS